MKPSTAIRRCCLLILLLSAVKISAAQVTENFDAVSAGQLPAGWINDGGDWRVADGKLQGKPGEGQSESTLFFGDRPWHGVAVEMDVEFTSAREPGRWFGIVVRDSGEDNPGIQFTARQDCTRGNGFEIGCKLAAPASGWKVYKTARGKTKFELGQTHRLRIESVGPWICGYFDGVMIVQSIRGDEVAPNGRVGVRVNGVTVMIDNITITQLAPPEPSELQWPRTRPLVVAHRGFSWVAPENTLASYRLAIEAGAEMAECDVYKTTDGVVVLLHDKTLKRTTGAEGKVEEWTYEKLCKLDAGRWKSEKYAGEPIPTLEETLKLVKGRLRLVIEIKQQGIEREVIAAIKAAGVEPEDVMIFSFNHDVVAKIAELEPLLPTTWLQDEAGVDKESWQQVIRDAMKARVSAIGLAKERVEPGFVGLAHQCGLPVFVWTVNEEADMRHLMRVGVDAIITDRPDVLLKLLKQER